MEKMERWDWKGFKSPLPKIFKTAWKYGLRDQLLNGSSAMVALAVMITQGLQHDLQGSCEAESHSKTSAVSSAMHLWPCCRLCKHGIHLCLKKNPQSLTEIQKFSYVSDGKNPASRFWYTGNVRKTGSFWFYHHLFETGSGISDPWK